MIFEYLDLETENRDLRFYKYIFELKELNILL